MTNLTDKIAELKEQYPTLRNGSKEDGYVELNVEEYEAIIQRWAEVQLAEEEAEKARIEAEAAKAAQRQALLAKLGITEDEARLLLGGN